jgi:hypothetical protein
MDDELLIEADTIEEAEKKARTRLARGMKISSQKILSFDLPASIECEEINTEKAFSDLEKQIPAEASIISREELRPAGEWTVEVEAANKEKALYLAKAGLSNSQGVREITLVRKARRGFLGIGKRPNLFHVVVREKARARLTYKMKARLLFTLARKELIDAVGDNDPLEEIKTYLDGSEKVNMRDAQGRTPLIIAAQKGSLEIALLLLSNMADVNACDENGNTALILSPSAEVSSLLLSNGADVNASNSWGMSALCNAAKEGNETLVRLLLEHGADPDHRDCDGFTALIRASMHGYDRIVDILLAKGANVHFKTKTGHTAMTLALENQQPHIAQTLQKAGG